jgi:hypothetical protein
VARARAARATVELALEQHVLRNPGDWTAEDLFE